ncbi:hypothetical protein LguiA_003130 [Lonicera macranthoides]
MFSQSGQFDGIIGFSQGATMAASVCAQKSELKGEIYYRFPILYFRFTVNLAKFERGSIKCPSLHIFGNEKGEDIQIENRANRELASLFEDGCSMIIEHDNERDLTQYARLYKDAVNGHWKLVEEFFDEHEDALSAKITKSSETVLHIAVGAGQKAVHFVEKFVGKMHKEALSSQDSQGDTALGVAAITGNTKAARILVKKETDLLYIKDNEGRLPVHLAARYGNTHVIVLTECHDESN